MMDKRDSSYAVHQDCYNGRLLTILDVWMSNLIVQLIFHFAKIYMKFV